MPVTFMPFIVIWEIGILGSMGAVASTVIDPESTRAWRGMLERYAEPRLNRSLLDLGTSVVPYLLLVTGMLTPIGTGCVENGFSRDHRTGVFAVMGAMLKVPIAENCTIPLEAFASADMGVTMRLCS